MHHTLRPTELPELNVAGFAFLLNFPWEMWQVPLFRRMPAMPHWEAVRLCTQAAGGDAVIAVLCFWTVAMVVQSRHWIRAPQWPQVLGFVVAGLLITVAMERLAIATGRWAYDEAMPVMPVLEVGLAPLLQWLVLPPLTVWLVQRQLRCTGLSNSGQQRP